MGNPPRSPSGLVLLREEWSRLDDLAEEIADGLGRLSSYHLSGEEIPTPILDPLRQSLLRLARLLTPPVPYHITPYAYAVKPADEAWLAQLDRFVDAIKKDGRLQAAARRHGLEPIVAQ